MVYFRKKRAHNQVQKPVDVGVHKVIGDIDGIEFLKNGDANYIESLFWFAKRYGFSEYSYDDETYKLMRRKDISYEVQKKETDTEEFVREFRG
jgi:hypothetical protein